MKAFHVILVAIFLLGCGPLSDMNLAAEKAGERADSRPALINIESFVDVGPGDWPQWGGPSRDFKVSAPKLADSWPEAGPPVKWRRPLGEGYSAIAAKGNGLYTMYRKDDKDVVIALNAATGKTLWEHAYVAPPHEGNTDRFGTGPNATPLVLDDRVITLGFTGIMQCLDLTSGKPIWSHDFVKDFGEIGRAHV